MPGPGNHILPQPFPEFLVLLIIKDPFSGQQLPVAVRCALRTAPLRFFIEIIEQASLAGKSFLIEIDFDQAFLWRHFCPETVLADWFLYGDTPALRG